MTSDPPPGKRKDQSRTPASQDLLLDLNFIPEWARAPAGRNPYADHDYEVDRGERGRRFGGRDRRRDGDDRQGRRQRDRQRREPRGGHRDRDGRARGGPVQGGGQARGQDRQGGRSPDRRPRGDRDRRPRGERGRPSGPNLPIDVRFLPDRHKLGAMVREMHHTGKAYPVMELASLFIRKSDHYLVKLQVKKRKGEETPLKLYQFAHSRHLFTHRDQAVQFALNRYLDDFYDVEETAGEEPSGNFVCVGRCTITGALLGPPNYHGFQSKLHEMVATRFPNFTLEEYRQKVETVHDPELVNQWKEQMRVQKRYRVKRKRKEGSSAEGPGVLPADAAAERTALDNQPPHQESGEATAQKPQEPASEDAPAPEREESAGGTESIESSSVSDSLLEADPPAEPAPGVEVDDREAMTWQEARQHLREHYLDGQIREVTRAVIPATVAQELEDQGLKQLIREAWQRESRFPLSLSLAMRPAFRHMRLHLFKVGRKHVFVTPVPPKPLDPGAAIDSIRTELKYLQDHPGCTRRALIEALRPGAALDSPEVAEVTNNLRWLTEKGHVIEFYDGTLALPSRPKSSAPASEGDSMGKATAKTTDDSARAAPSAANAKPDAASPPSEDRAPEAGRETPPSAEKPVPAAPVAPAPAPDRSPPTADTAPPEPVEEPAAEAAISQTAASDESGREDAKTKLAAELAAAMMQGPSPRGGDRSSESSSEGSSDESAPGPSAPTGTDESAKALADAMMQGPQNSPVQVVSDSSPESDQDSENSAEPAEEPDSAQSDESSTNSELASRPEPSVAGSKSAS